MSTMKIKKGDLVKVIAGKDKDKEGKVISVNPKNRTVLVEGINIDVYKRQGRTDKTSARTAAV